jgi:hypothetical protein
VCRERQGADRRQQPRRAIPSMIERSHRRGSCKLRWGQWGRTLYSPRDRTRKKHRPNGQVSFDRNDLFEASKPDDRQDSSLDCRPATAGRSIAPATWTDRADELVDRAGLRDRNDSSDKRNLRADSGIGTSHYLYFSYHPYKVAVTFFGVFEVFEKFGRAKAGASRRICRRLGYKLALTIFGQRYTSVSSAPGLGPGSCYGLSVSEVSCRFCPSHQPGGRARV